MYLIVINLGVREFAIISSFLCQKVQNDLMSLLRARLIHKWFVDFLLNDRNSYYLSDVML